MGLEVETKFLEAVEMGDFNAEKDTPEYELMGQEIFQNSTDLNRLKTKKRWQSLKKQKTSLVSGDTNLLFNIAHLRGKQYNGTHT
jgi:endonuclease/exonuclease/phosphatase family metal-dependent hydrolase